MSELWPKAKLHVAQQHSSPNPPPPVHIFLSRSSCSHNRSTLQSQGNCSLAHTCLSASVADIDPSLLSFSPHVQALAPGYPQYAAFLLHLIESESWHGAIELACTVSWLVAKLDGRATHRAYCFHPLPRTSFEDMYG